MKRRARRMLREFVRENFSGSVAVLFNLGVTEYRAFPQALVVEVLPVQHRCTSCDR
jgi:hypothetical protein